MKFDLSGLNMSSCSSCDDSEKSELYSTNETFDQLLKSQPRLSFSFGIANSNGTGLVRRFATPVLQHFGVEAENQPCTRADDPENDQYSVKNGNSLCWSVLIRNDTGRLHNGSLLGNFGHVERLAAWTHLISGIAFLIYALLRPFYVTVDHTIAQSCTTSAAGSVAFAFLSSTIFHVTSPSKRLAVWTRQLDYFSIYTAMAFGYVADFAIATRSFENTSLLAVFDGPLACAIVAVFFLIRRTLLSAEETWDSYLGGCTISFGLMRKMHMDLAHTGARQATSFLLSISYFVTVPVLYDNFGSMEATTILLLECACIAILILGMVIDNAIVFPDVLLSEGKGPRFLACTNCGCIATSHSLWHILSVIAAVKGAASREYALSLQ